MNKAERLIDLIAMLLEAERPVTLERIRSSIPGYDQTTTPSFKRMFERDKSELREMGIPILVEPLDPLEEAQGYRIPKEEYYLPEITLTPEEKVALFDTMFAYAGTLSVHQDHVVHHVDMSWNKVWEGTEQIRFISLQGDHLEYRSAPSRNPLNGRECIHTVRLEKVRGY